MTDVLMYHTPEGGEITLSGGEPLYTDGIETAVFLSLFGGQAEDDATDATKHRQWWGNWEEPDPARRYRSATQALLRGLPAIPANLRRVEDAVVADLQWLITSGLATSVSASARMPAAKRIEIRGAVVIDGRTTPFRVETDWA